ncbi:MAG: Rid family hydrolase [Paludibacter sp.]
MLFINYRTFSATDAVFSETLSQLLKNIPEKERVLTISIFGWITDDDYLPNLEIIKQTSQQIFGQLPLLSYVAQSPQDKQTLIVEVGYLTDGISASAVNFHEIASVRYLTIDTKEFSALLMEGLMCDNLQKSIREQSSEIFNTVQRIFNEACMSTENIVRQWNYIGQITAIENNRQNYQEFNNERARFYASANWKDGFPAATGISMNIHAVIVSLIAVNYHDNTRILTLNNSLQLAAHSYSETVLGKSENKETPKFERAKIIAKGESGCCFISGTAAILGENSLGNEAVETQTSQTIALIRHLISPENLKVNGIDFSGELKIVHLRVYVKNTADFELVRQVVGTEFREVSVFYVCAPVCRAELLVEIEGIATTEGNQMPKKQGNK